MRIDSFDTDAKVMLVAEIGNNHEGDFNAAVRLVDAAAESGADAVKLQTFRTEHYISRSDSTRFRKLKGYELAEAQVVKLRDRAKAAGLLFVSTPFDLGSARFLTPLVDAFKIASGDNTFFPLLDAVARAGKPILLSAGLADMRTIRAAAAFIEGVWAGAAAAPGLAVLHCVTSYPVPPEEANLGAIADLRANLECVVGYSDHTLGIEAPALAVALGARIVEKHFTLDKNASSFRDHHLSATPEEFRQMAARIRLAERLLGGGRKTPQPCETALLPQVRRSIAAARPLKAGDALRLEDLTWTRPSGGLPPGQEMRLLGKRLKCDLDEGGWILPNMVV